MGTKLTIPELHVIMTDGAEYDVQTLNIDMITWERERAKHGWPKPEDAPLLWLTFLAWHALVKTQKLLPSDVTYRQFEETLAQVNTNDKDALEVDPTNPAVELE